MGPYLALAITVFACTLLIIVAYAAMRPKKSHPAKCRHYFQPRYSSYLPAGMKLEGEYSDSSYEAMKTHMYIHDICIRCGEVVSNE